MGNDMMVVSFPELLPATRREAVPGVRYLDPGLSTDLEPEARFAPEGLPLPPEAAAGWLSQTTGYAVTFEPGDLSTAGAASKATEANPWGDPTSAIISELLALGRGADTSREDERKSLLRAQSVLLLAWDRERGLSEAGALGKDFGSGLGKLGESLGLDEDGFEELGADAAGFEVRDNEYVYAAPDEWKPVLRAALRLLPGDAVLFADTPPVVELWRDMDLSFESVEGDALAAYLPDAPGGEYFLARCPGFRLLGKTRVPEDAPWLEAERAVLIRVSGEEG